MCGRNAVRKSPSGGCLRKDCKTQEICPSDTTQSCAHSENPAKRSAATSSSLQRLKQTSRLCEAITNFWRSFELDERLERFIQKRYEKLNASRHKTVHSSERAIPLNSWLRKTLNTFLDFRFTKSKMLPCYSRHKIENWMKFRVKCFGQCEASTSRNVTRRDVRRRPRETRVREQRNTIRWNCEEIFEKLRSSSTSWWWPCKKTEHLNVRKII